jgi:nitroreductase
MLNFTVDSRTCTRCGACAADCPPRIISLYSGLPAIAPEKEAACYKCQHCLAICPTAAISILGVRPENCTGLAGNLPSPEALATLIKGRRSVRRYRDENLAPELLQQLLEVAWHAPTGVNSRQVRFTVVDDRRKMAEFRTNLLEELGKLVRRNALPAGFERYADFVRVWEEQGQDVLFRGAPHFLVASAPQAVVTPTQDCLIALSYFELYARVNGVGTVWDGLATLAVTQLVPVARQWLGIPDDHVVGYCMAFGPPAVSYQRTVQHPAALIHRVS